MYKIEYVGVTHRGLVRSVNEDAIVCGNNSLGLGCGNIGTFFHIEEQLKKPLQFGVFDGLGGEQCGEVASCKASQAYKNWKPRVSAHALQALCQEINQEICQFTAQNYLNTCGTTAAMIVVDSNRVISCNLGDSRIFLFHENSMEQLSVDHVLPNYPRKKAPLTQFLGIPEKEQILSPAFAEQPPQDGDQYLLCSDGLTDMVEEADIQRIMYSECPLKEKAEKLLEGALEGGGRDNISIVLLQLSLTEEKEA